MIEDTDTEAQGIFKREISFILTTIPISRKIVAEAFHVNFSTWNKFCNGDLPFPAHLLHPLYDFTGDKRLLKFMPRKNKDDTCEFVVEFYMKIISKTCEIGEQVVRARNPGQRHMTNEEIRAIVREAAYMKAKWESFMEYLESRKR